MISEGVHQRRPVPQAMIIPCILDCCWFVGCYLHVFVHIVVCMNFHWPVPCLQGLALPDLFGFSCSCLQCVHNGLRGRGHGCAGCRVHFPSATEAAHLDARWAPGASAMPPRLGRARCNATAAPFRLPKVTSKSSLLVKPSHARGRNLHCWSSQATHATA